MTVAADFTFFEGETWTINGSAKAADGTALNLTGATVNFRMIDLIDLTSLVLDMDAALIDPTNGLWRLEVTPGEQVDAGIQASDYLYEVRVELASGAVSTQNRGYMRVEDSIFEGAFG